MNEIRKQIIELIEPFMNKELREGCLVQKNSMNGKQYICELIIETYILEKKDGTKKLNKSEVLRDVNLSGYYFSPDFSNSENVKNFKKENKILGHYDISSILLFLNSCKDVVGWSFSGNKINIRQINKTIDIIHQTPLKPLCLYTEEEEEFLLELLLKLKQNVN